MSGYRMRGALLSAVSRSPGAVVLVYLYRAWKLIPIQTDQR